MFKRRHLLQFTGSMTLSAIAARGFSSPAKATPREPIAMLAWRFDGGALDRRSLNQLYFLNLADEPIPQPSRTVETGRLLSQLPPFPCAIALPLEVENFGKVTLYADNRGRGYQANDFPLDLNLEFARSRLHRVRAAVEQWQASGVRFTAEVESRLQTAQKLLDLAETTENDRLRVRWCDRSLAESLWGGEIAVFQQAKQAIASGLPRPEFLFGCNFFQHPQAGEEYDRLFARLFNFATIPFYWRSFEPERGEPRFARTDAMVNWLQQANITPKGHPLVWFHEASVPNWLRGKSYATVKAELSERILEIVTHYGDRLPYYDIINEAHGVSWANELDFTPDQFLELTRLASLAVQAGDRRTFRIINSCCLWAENVAYFGPPQRSPYSYLRACLDAEIPFEAIGLQLYYPGQDMFEIHRLLERFGQLGKPIHITELGVSSDNTTDERSLLKQPRGWWHAPWSETVQADWVEQFYTLCYSKAYIQAITWWDFADRGHFWPHGGLLRADLTPKLAYQRLLSLRDRWSKSNSQLN